MKCGDILIVDDNLATLEALTILLGDEGLKYRCAPNGAVALMLARSMTPDLILLDVNLPDISGFEVCRKLKADEGSLNVPVIFISADTEESSILEGFAAGGVDYITKPIRRAEALARVHTHLDFYRLQRAQAEQKAFLEAVLNNIADGVVACDENGHLSLSNKASQQLHGPRPRKLPPETWAKSYDLYHADGITPMAMTEIPLYKAFNEGDVDHSEMVVAPKGGARRLFICNGQAMYGHSGEKIGAVVSMHDVTEQRRAEDVLRDSERRLRESQKIAKLGEWILDVPTGELFWSDEIFTIFELDPKAFQPNYKSFLKTIHPDDRDAVNQAYKQSLETKSHYDIIHRLQMPDGRIKYVKENCRTDFDNDGQALRSVGTIQDITDLEIAKQAANDANQAKSEFLANMSHEIRTPMNAVLGFTEILKGKEDNPEKNRYIDQIQTSGYALLNLINDILDLSKIEAGRLDLHYEAVSVQRLLEELESIFNMKLLDKGVSLNIDIPEDFPPALILDEARLRQVLMNLLSNAIKFTDSGYIRIGASSHVTASESQSRVNIAIEVEDTGRGIPFEQQDAMFEPFEQAKGQKTSVYGGTGLGLTITKRLVEMMNGVITVESDLNKGSVFRINFQGVEVAAIEALNGKIARVADFSNIIFDPATILIADDIDYNREMLHAFIEDYNFKIIFAENGKEVLEKIKKYRPTLILLDMKMPVMDGYETAPILKKNSNFKDIPLIAVTASALKQDKDIIEDLCDGYLPKPISKSDLLRELMKFLPYTETVQDNPPCPTKERRTIFSGELAAIPKPLLHELQEAASIADIARLVELLEKVREIDPVIAGAVESMLNDFNYNAILALIAESCGDGH